jgi:uncharacterized protein YecE (DUF72 family)
LSSKPAESSKPADRAPESTWLRVEFRDVIIVGTSGWQYRSWRGVFYPTDVPQRQWLEHSAESFATVEVNNAFYRLPERDTFVQWRERTPDDFILAVKMSRYLTHIRRLREPADPVARFLGRADALGHKLGPVLLQLPPTLTADAELIRAVLEEFLEACERNHALSPPSLRVAIEPRHRSWWTDEIRDTLTERGVALCWSDRLGRPVSPLWRTADFGYVRLHEGRARPWPRYGQQALRTWVDRIGGTWSADEDVFVYFNNDPGGAAIADATALAAIADRRGLKTTRAPNVIRTGRRT